ncbi:MAG: NUDIX domain-containing protein [Haloarcula sp.]
MEVAERSRARVQEQLARLEQEFGSTAVDQTTFSVGPDAYQEAVERSREGQVDVRAFVRNEAGDVLLSEDNGSWSIPHGQTRGGERPASAAKRVVSDAAGVDCTIQDVVRATIRGVRNSADADDETVYRLSAVFDGEIDSTALGDGAVADAVAAGDTDTPIRWDEAAVAEFV